MLLDIEFSKSGRISAIGALLHRQEFRRDGKFDPQRALLALDLFAEHAEYVVGHNIIGHDLRLIRCLNSDLSLLGKPVIDTLFLSPLAFPENPYHRLVKDYKLVRDSVNDPVADARLAAAVFVDQWQSFVCLDDSELLGFYRHCFSADSIYRGHLLLFDILGGKELSTTESADVFRQLVGESVCQYQLDKVVDNILADPSRRMLLSYCVAWLRVADGNSVIPPWVRHRFPELAAVIQQLRGVNCGRPDCVYCNKAHDPSGQLKRFFGFDSFRDLPQTPAGESLQQKIVESAMSDRPLFAVLPTGGGKSLCYQLPALMRYQRRGVLTVVISPLQALMKDQVDNLRKKTGTPSAAALYGMLTAPERSEVLNGVRLGDVAILYVSPEQLRNRSFRETISQREIGTWVVDEAHCLSKWGHDFRPDYLYAARFIKEFSVKHKQALAAVQCFTATAKEDVQREIIDFFKRELGQSLRVFESSVERNNLRFEVQTVTRHEKYSILNQMLSERLPDQGSAIVYCATRKGTEEVRDFLVKHDWQAEAFHAGMDPAAKRHIQENFMNDTIRIICATNAFGMGIDKDDVRLIIHADIPGSLENYIQEAGRAGRDQQNADCILLYDNQDIESQFSLEAFNELSRKDIAQILRGVRRAKRNRQGEVVITAGELLRDDNINVSIDPGDRGANNKVVTAVAWLERAGFLQRNENKTQVFQGRPLIKNLEEAQQKIDKLALSSNQKKRWISILEVLINSDIDQGFSADELAELVAPLATNPDENIESDSLSESQKIIHTLHSMSDAGLLRQTMMLTAYVRYKVKNHSRLVLDKICRLEQCMLDALQEEAADADSNIWQILSLRRLNQRMLDQGESLSNPEVLRNLLVSLSQDGQGLAGSRGSIDMRYVGQNQYKVKLQRDWQSLRKTAELRRSVAKVILTAIFANIEKGETASGDLLVEFSSEDLLKALKANTDLRSRLQNPLAAMDRALMYLHEQRAITLQKGLAVFRQAMTLTIAEQSNGRQYSNGDYESLSRHYSERVFQIHVMNEYACKAVEKIGQALAFMLAYFSQDKARFVKQFFSDRRTLLERAVSQQYYEKIVEDLQNPVQSAIVAAPEDDNILILAGPGSGKTRVVVHRCAYLLKVLRVPASSILMLCFNRNAVTALKSRLRALIGHDANRVTIQTYHGIAMRLTGHSMAVANESQRALETSLSEIINNATALLNNEMDLPWMDGDQFRERLLNGYRHILVDEYQDIDEQQYRLVSAIAGRSENDPDMKLSILAVGDDDQNIYHFRGSSTDFIKRFESDYQARIHYLLENYRSTAHILSAANAVIGHNQDRMKKLKDITVNRSRASLSPGGGWQDIDPYNKGRVQIIEVADNNHQAQQIIQELQRLKQSDGGLGWRQCAVLAREWSVLDAVRCYCEQVSIPISMFLPAQQQPPIFRIREIAVYLADLASLGNQHLTAENLNKRIPNQKKNHDDHPWLNLLKQVMLEWQSETNNDELPVKYALEYLYEALAEQRQNCTLTDGVFLSTVHSAKGLEFTHVFVADGGWQYHPSNEDERRLYYVAMTRAKETLTLLQRHENIQSFANNLAGDYVIRRTANNKIQIPLRVFRFALLGMQDLNLSFAGFKPPTHRIHRVLESLHPGTCLEIHQRGEKIMLERDSCSIAQLSKAATTHWLDRLSIIESVQVLAMVRRYRKDGDNHFQDQYRTDCWEVPIVEIRYNNESASMPDMRNIDFNS